MLDSTTQNLSERLTEVRKTLGTLITKVNYIKILEPAFWYAFNIDAGYNGNILNLYF